MAAVASEKNANIRASLGPNKETQEYQWQVIGATTRAQAFATIVAAAPTTMAGSLGTLNRDTITVQEVDTGQALWDATVAYVLPDWQDKNTGDTVFGFSTTGGTQHIKNSLQTIAAYNAGGSVSLSSTNVTNFQGAINVDDSGGVRKADGVDITVPVYVSYETHYIAPTNVTNAYKRQLYQTTGKVNAGTFKEFQAGECLFQGVEGTVRGKGDYELTFHFAGSSNTTTLPIPGFGPISKKGWEYVWVYYEERLDANGTKKPVLTPKYAYVEQVYLTADFSVLAIGT